MNTDKLVDLAANTLQPDGYAAALPKPESPYALYYRGDNKVHLCKNDKPVSSEGQDLYYVKVAGVGRGQVELLLTPTEYTRAQRRAVLQRNVIPEAYSWANFFSTLFDWK